MWGKKRVAINVKAGARILRFFTPQTKTCLWGSHSLQDDKQKCSALQGDKQSACGVWLI